MANQYGLNCPSFTREGHRCKRKAPPALDAFSCWQHKILPARVRCCVQVEPPRDRRRCSRRGLHTLEGDAGDELYCTQHVNKLRREHGLAEVVPAYRQRQEERRRREEERERLHPRRRSPRLVAREIAAAAAAQLEAAREQRRAANRVNQNLRRSARIAARRGDV